MRRIARPAPRLERGGTIVLLASISFIGLAACGDDESAAESMPVSEWVAAFDQLCLEVTGPAAADLTEAEFKDLSDRGLAEMRELPPPDEHATEASAMLAAIESNTDPAVSDEEIEAADEQFLDAAAVLGVSQECIGGPQGRG